MLGSAIHQYESAVGDTCPLPQGVFVLKCSQITNINKVDYHSAINEAGYILLFSPL